MMADNAKDNGDGTGEKSTYQVVIEKAVTPECLMGFVAGMAMPRKFAAGLAVGIVAGIYVQQTFMVPDVKKTSEIIMEKVQETVPKKP